MNKALASPWLIRVKLASAVILLVVVAIVPVILFAVATGNVKATVTTLVNNFRKQQALTIDEQVATTLRPGWVEAQRLSDNMRLHNNDWPPTYDTFTNATARAQLLRSEWPLVDRITHMLKASSNANQIVYDNYVGQVFALTDVDVANKSQCNSNNVHYAHMGFIRAAPTYSGSTTVDSGLYLYDLGLNLSAAPASRSLSVFDAASGTIGPQANFGPFPVQLPPLSCAASMGALWGAVQQPAYGGFAWFGPYNPQIGWGNHFEGNVPVIDRNGKAVGRAGVALSFLSISDLLKVSISNGGTVTQGGFAMIYTLSGFVIGFTENFDFLATRDMEVQLGTAYFQSRSPTLNAAVAQVAAVTGALCPSTQQLLDFTMNGVTHFLTVSPIDIQAHGLPPLTDPWCQMLLFPQNNVLQDFNTALAFNIGSIVVVGAGFFAIVFLVSIVVFLTVQESLRAKRELDEHIKHKVEEIERDSLRLRSPFVLIHESVFSKYDMLPMFEAARDNRETITLDTVEAVDEFKQKGNKVIFFSHEWLGFSHPDPQGLQLKTMTWAIDQLVLQGHKRESLWVWIDVSSIPQANKGSQTLAIQSLAAYAAKSDFFVAIVPDARHVEGKKDCNHASYNQRGWCRMEILARVCSCGLHETYFVTGNPVSGILQMTQPSQDQFDELPLRVFQGEFTCCAQKHKGKFVSCDKEFLVEPVLGLYMLCMKGQRTVKHMQPVCKAIADDKNNFFPKKHIYNYEDKYGDHTQVSRTLFGPMVEAAEEFLGYGTTREEEGSEAVTLNVSSF